jgi:hypothetical protein
MRAVISTTAILWLVCGCSAGNPGDGPGGRRDSGGGGGVDAGGGGGVDSGGGGPRDAFFPGFDATCDRITVEARPELANVLIVLDRSGSMYDFGPFGEGVDRWTPSVMAIESVTSALEDRLSFGLMLFGSDEECGTGAVRVPPAIMNAMAIRTALAGSPDAQTGGGTPTSASLERARTELMGVPGQSFVLLVTDGAPNCNPGLDSTSCRCTNPAGCFFDSLNCLDDMRAVAAVTALAAAGIPTFVIGYDTGMWADVMDRMAAAGDTGMTRHLPVDDRASLESALMDIGGSVVSCSYELSAPPGDIRYVRVTVDGAMVDHESVRMDGSGWRLEGDRTIELIGADCANVQDGEPHSIEVVVECTPVII